MPVSDHGLVDTPPRSPRATAGGRRIPAAVRDTLVLLGVLDAAVAANSLWVAQAVALALLLTLPGFLALRALRFSPASLTRSPGWIPSASIVVLTATALGVDLVGPVLGVDRPLDVWPLALTLNVVCAGLAALRGAGAPLASAAAAWRAVDRRASWALLVPALAAAATLRLNNGSDDLLPAAAATAAVALLAACLWRAVRWSTQRLGWMLTSASLALVLGFSLRSDYVFGWDVSAEYSLIQATIATGAWTPSHPGDAYGAMLSLTTFPALLHSLTGMSGLVIVKLVYPVLLSLVPVVVMVLLRSVLSARVAAIAAMLLLTQLSFISELPALARQEVALLLFVSLLAAMVDTSLRERPRLVLLALLTAGVVVSHYSTTYTLLTVVALAVLIQPFVARRHGSARADPRKLVVVGTALLLGVGWYQAITNSTEHALATVSRLVESGLQVLPSTDGEGTLQAYLRGPKPPRTVTVPEYEAAIATDFAREKPWIVPAQDALDGRWTLQPADDAPDQSPSPLLLRAANLAALVFGQALVLITVGGTVVLLLRRRVAGTLLDFALLAAPSVLLLGLVRLSATIAESYGQDRLYIQLMPIVAVPALWGLGAAWSRLDGAAARVRGSTWRRMRRPVRRVLVLAVSAYVLALVAMSAGLVRAAAGDQSAANLFNSGEHYSRFYVTAPEVASAQWLGRVQPAGSLTYADGHAQLRIYGYGVPKGVILTDITPRTVDVNSWVYGSRFNTVTGDSRSWYDSQWIVYRFPRDFLVDQLGVAYTNGTSEVFHR